MWKGLALAVVVMVVTIAIPATAQVTGQCAYYVNSHAENYQGYGMICSGTGAGCMDCSGTGTQPGGDPYGWGGAYDSNCAAGINQLFQEVAKHEALHMIGAVCL